MLVGPARYDAGGKRKNDVHTHKSTIGLIIIHYLGETRNNYLSVAVKGVKRRNVDYSCKV